MRTPLAHARGSVSRSAQNRDRKGVRMALWAADSDESRDERCGMFVAAWAVKIGSALDQLKPSGSMTWDMRESQ